MAIEQWLVDEPKTIDLENVRSLDVHTLAGTVSVLTHSLPTARVEVAGLTGRPLKVAIDGDRLIIDHPQLSWPAFLESARTLLDQPRADVSVLVPADVDLKVRTSSAEVVVVGIDGRIDSRTVTGGQFLDRTRGDATLRSAGGELSVRDHRGSLSAGTATGDITVTGEFSSFSSQTAAGSTLIDVTAGLPDVIDVSSVTGSQTVRLPDDAHPAYRINTVTSAAQLDELHVEPLYGKGYSTPPSAYQRGMTDVRMSTASGRIVVLRSGRASTERADGSFTTTSPSRFAGASTVVRGIHRTLPSESFDARIDERVGAAREELGVTDEVEDAEDASVEAGAGTEATEAASEAEPVAPVSPTPTPTSEANGSDVDETADASTIEDADVDAHAAPQDADGLADTEPLSASADAETPSILIDPIVVGDEERAEAPTTEPATAPGRHEAAHPAAETRTSADPDADATVPTAPDERPDAKTSDRSPANGDGEGRRIDEQRATGATNADRASAPASTGTRADDGAASTEGEARA